MSTPTVLQGNQVPLMFSTDDITYKSVVCNRAWGLNLDSSVTNEESDCGTFPALGSVAGSFSFEGIVNTTPNGATEISAKGLLDLANNQTLVYIKMMFPNPGGTDLYVQGTGYITNFQVNKATGSLLSFQGTFTASGALDTSV